MSRRRLDASVTREQAERALADVDAAENLAVAKVAGYLASLASQPIDERDIVDLEAYCRIWLRAWSKRDLV